ncbi:hypothetical protein GCM10009560_79400 [Nonomuraea longicatena]|uniref:Transmembrane protein n=1 Tax=Nonomuraea longicatena TaxID=83682 RepID=A0ABN1RE16_9ACTN
MVEQPDELAEGTYERKRVSDFLSGLAFAAGVTVMASAAVCMFLFLGPPILYAWNRWYAYWERKWRARP